MTPVILGAGLAGISVALALAPLPVRLVSPKALGEGCSSALAQGGIAAAVGAGDDPENHVRDTLAAGNGLCDAAIVRQTIFDAPKIIDWLAGLGVSFDRDAAGNYLLGMEAAHGRKRIVHVKDGTGLAAMQALIKRARETPSIDIIEAACAVDLIVDKGAVSGVVLRKDGKDSQIDTSCVVLATGSSLGLWRDTTVPHENWGSGLALALRAGATLGNLEFVQFHPTAIDVGRDPMPLASESLRGAGAFLVDEGGTRFTDEMQARDVVTRAIWNRMAEGHRVFLDARGAIGKEFAARFPTVYALCVAAGVDPAVALIPVRPSGHYHMGGVLTDACGRTDVRGLWACGEVACTGLHGANRLASNSLLEAASFGRRVATDIREKGDVGPWGTFDAQLLRQAPLPAPLREEDSFFRDVSALMSECVGVIRDAKGLKRAVDVLRPLAAKSDIALVGLAVAVSALRREESRGAHFRKDFPHADALARRSTFRLSDLEVFR